MNMIQQQGRTLKVEDGRFSYTAADRSLGWEGVGFSLTTHHGTGKGGFEYYTHSGSETFDCREVTEIEGGLRMIGSYGAPGLEEVISLRLLEGGALRVERLIRNAGETSHVVRGASAAGAAGGRPVFSDNHIWRARFCHMDNVRTEKYPWCRPEYPCCSNGALFRMMYAVHTSTRSVRGGPCGAGGHLG
jgi:hypothetical protein